MATLPRKRCTGLPNCPQVLPAGTRYCDSCALLYERRRGSRQSRGYDAHHDALRRHYARRLDEGETFICSRCQSQSALITANTPWHLDHTDDRTDYLGPAHEGCNVSAGGKKSRRSS